MSDDQDLIRQYAAELARIGISEEASRYFGVGGRLEDAIAELRAFPSGIGTDEFFRRTHGVDFATWRRDLESAMASGPDAT